MSSLPDEIFCFNSWCLHTTSTNTGSSDEYTPKYNEENIWKTLFKEGDTQQSVMTDKPFVLRFQNKMEFGDVAFWGEGKTRVHRQKPLRARTRTINKVNPHMKPRLGIKPRLHWWEASALTTAPSLTIKWKCFQIQKFWFSYYIAHKWIVLFVRTDWLDRRCLAMYYSPPSSRRETRWLPVSPRLIKRKLFR